MALGDIYRFTRKVLLDGQLHVNVLHFVDTVGTSETPEADLKAAWDDEFSTQKPESLFFACQRGYTSLTKIGYEIQRISPTEGEIEVFSMDTDPPAALDSGLPSFAQTRFTINTERNDRSGRGGFYIGGIPEGQTEGNNVDSGYQTQQDNLINGLIQVFTSGGSQFSGFELGVWSRLLSVFNILTSLSAAVDMGTMRSRRAGRGV